MKKYFAGLLILASILMTLPVLATDDRTSSTPSLSQQERILEAQRKLEERFQEAKNKLQERLTALQTRQVNQSAAIACVGLAVNSREQSISASWNTYSAAQLAALNTRSAALSAAWSTPSSTTKQIRTAVDTAWNSYRTAHKTAVTAHNASTTQAWNTFKTASKACKASQSGVSVDNRSYGQDMAQ